MVVLGGRMAAELRDPAGQLLDRPHQCLDADGAGEGVALAVLAVEADVADLAGQATHRNTEALGGSLDRGAGRVLLVDVLVGVEVGRWAPQERLEPLELP